MRGSRYLIAGGITLAFLACSGGVPQPVEIVLNEETCSHCRMAVSQREFAAEVVTVSGSLDVFDDIGCLVQWMAEHQPPESAGLFVVDFESGEWLDAKAAYYIRSEKLPTPMSFGLAAFKSEAAARAVADELEGEVILWPQVLGEEVQ
jgi:copper chaperone NosL